MEPEWTEEQKLVWGILEERRGIDAAITAGRISKMLSMYNGGYFTEVHVRMIIRELIIVHRHPIASTTTTDKKGYFVAITQDEKIRYLNSLRSRMREMRQRLEAFEEITAEEDGSQLGLFSEEGREGGQG